MRQPIPFGKYVLLERISVGGMAEVFKAKSFGVEGFEKILAIKRILPSMAEDAEFIQMFIDEAKICGQLNHANICQIFELGRVSDSHFIAMEYVWGKDVLQIQNRFRKLRHQMRPEMAAFMAAKLCEGLDYAHKKKDAAGRPLGIIHRDVSPQNILISYDGELKVIDFGIAKAAARSSKTQAGVLKGKFGYMSPEQVRGLPLDRRSDLFAIGTILYEVLTSDRLFLGASDFETLEKVRNVDVPPIQQINPLVPQQLDRIIMKALARDPEDRYQWASEMQEDLQAFLISNEPVFTAKTLANWMREQFAVEMRREQQVLDEQRRIGKEALLGGGDTPAPPRRATQSLATMRAPSQMAQQAQAPNKRPSGDELQVDDLEEIEEGEGEKTTVAESSFIDGAPRGGGAVEFPNDSTLVLVDNEGAMAEAARALDTPTPQLGIPLSNESTVILDGSGAPKQGAAKTPSNNALKALFNSSPSQPGPPPTGPSGRVSTGQVPLVAPPGNPSVGSLTPGSGQVLPPLPYPPAQRSTLWKDVLIGVSVAVAVVGGVLTVRAMMGRGAATRGTLVVVVTPARPADVSIDGKLRGHIDGGTPLKIKDLEVGTHTVQVRTADGAEFKQSVALVAGDVSILNATVDATSQGPTPSSGPNGRPVDPSAAPLASPAASVSPSASPAAPTMGRLKLTVVPEGAEVDVDGAQLPDGAKDPIPLRADTAHEIRITKPARQEVKLTLTVKAGEEVERRVTLPPYGTLNVVTEPSGAEVDINGKRVGVSPVSLEDLDPAHQAHLLIRLRGYEPIYKMINFDRELHQSLSFHLVVSGSETPSSDGAGARPVVLNDTAGDKKRKGQAKAERDKEKVERSDRSDKGGDSKSDKSDKEQTNKLPGLKAPPPEDSTAKPGSDDKGKSAAAASGDGYLVANTQPFAKVLIDGKDTGKITPIPTRAKIALKPGKHTVTFVANGKKYNFDVTIEAAKDTRLIKQLTDAN